MSAPLQFLVHLVQEQVGQNSCLQVMADDPEQTPIAYRVLEFAYQHVVVDSIEKPLQIDVYYAASPVLNVALRLAHSIMCPAPRPAAVTMLAEG